MYSLAVIPKINYMNSCILVEVRRYTPLAMVYKNSMDCKSNTTNIYDTATATNGEPITMVTAAEPQPKCSPLTKAKVTSDPPKYLLYHCLKIVE